MVASREIPGVQRPPFELAAGSVPGRRHLGTGPLLVGRSNQDAWAACRDSRGLVAVVCDGCSGGAQSEVGAALGARWAVAAARAEILEGPGALTADGAADPGRGPDGAGAEDATLARALERVRRRILGRLRLVLGTLGGDPSAALQESLLFTVILGVVTPRRVVVAALGDGVVYVNGAATRLGPFPGNAPPYLAYGLLGRPPGTLRGDDLRFRVVCDRPGAEVRHLLLGTDGVEDLARAAAAGARLPGRIEALGPVSQFWTEDRYFDNPDALRRRLALANSEHLRWDTALGRAVRAPGLLPDDTTLVAIRRIGEGPAPGTSGARRGGAGEGPS